MGSLRVGAVEKEITPPKGTDLSGYILRFGSSTGIHDPLWASFLLIEDGTEQVLLISLDVLYISNDFSRRVKGAISQEIKIEKKNILIAATHTHSAPGIHIFRNGGKRDKKWEERVFHLLIQGASESKQKLAIASLGSGVGFLVIGKNRRKKGGPVDPYFPLICFCDERNLPVAVCANYGCHPVVLDEKNLLISADYINYFRAYLNEFISTDIFTLFFTGASGDVDPVNRGRFSMADKYGKILAEEALEVIERMEFKTDIKIRVEEDSLKIPYDWIPSQKEAEKIYKDHLSQYEEAIKKGKKEEIKIQRAFLLWAEEIREKAGRNELPKYLECKLQCIHLGETIFLTFPFELFSSISMALRKRAKIDSIFMVGYANGYCGYLPDEKSFSEGGYEIEEAFKYCGLLPLSSQAEKLFTEKALSLLK